jgi:hypothetical protein
VVCSSTSALHADDGSAMQLRADLGARRALSENDQFPHAVDYVQGLGLQYSWGGTR